MQMHMDNSGSMYPNKQDQSSAPTLHKKQMYQRLLKEIQTESKGLSDDLGFAEPKDSLLSGSEMAMDSDEELMFEEVKEDQAAEFALQNLEKNQFESYLRSLRLSTIPRFDTRNSSCKPLKSNNTTHTFDSIN